jgi:ferredoxin
MTVRVNPDNGQGHARRARAGPDAFTCRDFYGPGTARFEAMPAVGYDAVRDAATTCPELAIEISV